MNFSNIRSSYGMAFSKSCASRCSASMEQTPERTSSVSVQMQDILGHLRGMPEEHLAWMLDRVATERHKYAYRQNLQQTPSAVSVIMSNMCTLKKGPGAATA